jgi:hypothetical protein
LTKKAQSIEDGYKAQQYSVTGRDLKAAYEEYSKWKKEETPFINLMITRFMMKKAAKAWERSSVSKSGALDMNAIHAYKHKTISS